MPLHVGIDENGLGPRLGPLIVTAVTARCEGNGVKIANGPPGRSFARLGDSKDLVAHGNSSLGEAWARAIAATSGRGKDATTPDALVAAMCIDSAATLRSRCPSGHEAQCWSPDTEQFTSDDKLRANVTKDLKRL
ncbi:MAG: hypothetical protein ABIP39_04370, partial [Polyangiaceae bacterium]